MDLLWIVLSIPGSGISLLITIGTLLIAIFSSLDLISKILIIEFSALTLFHDVIMITVTPKIIAIGEHIFIVSAPIKDLVPDSVKKFLIEEYVALVIALLWCQLTIDAYSRSNKIRPELSNLNKNTKKKFIKNIPRVSLPVVLGILIFSATFYVGYTSDNSQEFFELVTNHTFYVGVDFNVANKFCKFVYFPSIVFNLLSHGWVIYWKLIYLWECGETLLSVRWNNLTRRLIFFHLFQLIISFVFFTVPFLSIFFLRTADNVHSLDYLPLFTSIYTSGHLLGQHALNEKMRNDRKKLGLKIKSAIRTPSDIFNIGNLPLVGYFRRSTNEIRVIRM